jgi:hypothetical protein
VSIYDAKEAKGIKSGAAAHRRNDSDYHSPYYRSLRSTVAGKQPVD